MVGSRADLQLGLMMGGNAVTVNTSVQPEMVFRVACLAGGIGGAAIGFQRAAGEWMGHRYRYELVGSLDVDPMRNRDYERLTGSKAYTVDLFTRQDYIAYHSEFGDAPDADLIPILERMRATATDGLVEHDGRHYWKYAGEWAEVVAWRPPPEDWEEVTPETMRRIFGSAPPDVFFHSMPCQGNSRLLPNAKARTWKYKALNNLVLRGICLCLLAWPDSPPPVIYGENVPGIKHRSAELLKDVEKISVAFGYATHVGDYDAGKIGGLSQTRPRTWYVQRHIQSVPQFVYRPAPQSLKPIKDAIYPLPMPGDPRGGPLHVLPNLEFVTWLRLALIPPGGHWPDIPGPGEWRLMTMDGREVPPEAFSETVEVKGKTKVRWFWPDRETWGRIFFAELLPGAKHYEDVRLQHSPMGGGRGAYWVQRPEESSGVVTADPSHRKSGGASCIADGRLSSDISCGSGSGRHGSHYRVSDPSGSAGTVTGANHIANGSPNVADGRMSYEGLQLTLDHMNAEKTHRQKLYCLDQNRPSGVVTGAQIGSGAGSLPDGRLSYEPRDNAYCVADPEKPSPTIPGHNSVTGSNGPGALGDPRMGCKPRNGTLGVVSWNGLSPTVIASLDVYCGQAAIEDRRVTLHHWPEWFPEGLIISPWNAWHRALTELEMAVLQGFEPFDEYGNPFTIEGNRKQRRQGIGNAVPPRAAEAIAHALAPTLIAASLDKEMFLLSPTGAGIWVNPAEPHATIDIPS